MQISLDKSEHVGGQNEEEYGVGALGCSESQLSRDTVISYQALSLMESETYYMLSTWPGPRDFWEWPSQATTSTYSSVSLLSTMDFNSPSIGLRQGAVDTTFLQQSSTDFRGLLAKSKAMKSSQKLPPKSNSLKAFTRYARCHGAKNGEVQNP